MLTTPNGLHRLAAVIATAFVSLVVTAIAAAMPLVPEGDPPIKVRSGHGSSAAAGVADPGGIDWSTAAVSAAYAAAIVLLVLAVVLVVVRARARGRGDVAPAA